MMAKAWAIGMVVVREMIRRKDFYVLFILTAVLTVGLGGISIFNDTRVVRYLKEICLSLIWVSALVISVTAAARQIPSEREHRTLFPLLAKPVSRWEVILGKYLGCLAASALALAVFYLFFTLVSLSRERDALLLNHVYAWVLHCGFASVVISMALLGSLLISTPPANATLCFLTASSILFLGRHLYQLSQSLAEPLKTLVQVVYFTMPHLEFFDVRDLVIHNHPALPLPAVLGALGYSGVYSALFLLAASLLFKRRPVI